MRPGARDQKRKTIFLAGLILVTQVLLASHLVSHAQEADGSRCVICVAVDGDTVVQGHAHSIDDSPALLVSATHAEAPIVAFSLKTPPVRGPPGTS